MWAPSRCWSLHPSFRTHGESWYLNVFNICILSSCWHLYFDQLLTLSCFSGNTGVAVLLYEPKKSYAISRIERESGVKFEYISAPQPADIARSAGSEAAQSIISVSDRYSQFHMLHLCRNCWLEFEELLHSYIYIALLQTAVWFQCSDQQQKNYWVHLVSQQLI